MFAEINRSPAIMSEFQGISLVWTLSPHLIAHSQVKIINLANVVLLEVPDDVGFDYLLVRMRS